MKIFTENSKKYKVLTPTGYKDFAGVAYMGDKPIFRIDLEDGKFLECTNNHKLYLADMSQIALHDILPDMLISVDGNVSKVIDITNTGRIESVYDLIEVEDGYRYFTNGILSSNCKFAGEESTLITGVVLETLKGSDPLFKTGEIRWYTKISPEKTYVVALDPGYGVGQDSACIEVFSLPDMVQVAEWCHNRTTVPNQVKTMQTIVNSIYHDIKRQGYKSEPEIYYTLENNSLGEAALQSVSDIGEENFQGQFLHEPKKSGTIRYRKGLNTNGRTKVAACTKLKSLIESNRLRINSKLLISELKFFVASGGSYAAKTGYHDDTVMSTTLCVRLMQMVVNWDDRVGDIIRDVFDDDIISNREPMPFSVMIN